MSTQATSSDRPRRSLKERKQELYREVILDAAEGVFANEGYDAAQVTQIAKSAGLSLTTLYRVLPSKWEIYRAVNQRRLSRRSKLRALSAWGLARWIRCLQIHMQLNF